MRPMRIIDVEGTSEPLPSGEVEEVEAEPLSEPRGSEQVERRPPPPSVQPREATPEPPPAADAIAARQPPLARPKDTLELPEAATAQTKAPSVVGPEAPAAPPAPPPAALHSIAAEGPAVVGVARELSAAEAVAELPDSEVAPDSQESPPEFGEAPPTLDDLLSDEEAEPVPGPQVASAPAAKPPPPPRRPAPPLPPPVVLTREPEDESKKPARRPWWEELFREDFLRAEPRLEPTQVRREVDFIEESLGVAAGGVILDLCCGSGNHAVELSSRGYGVVGYDLSLYQLALAGDVAEERDQKINFLQGDVREMSFEEMFDGVFCWNTSFGYFEEEKNFSVAQRIFRSLRPGGMLLLDVVNRDFAAQHSPSQVWYEGDGCVCMDDMSIDFITSRLRVKRSIILDDGRQRECSYSIRIYSLHELGKLLHDVGFRVAEASGHPSTPGIFFGPCSPRIIILAQKP